MKPGIAWMTVCVYTLPRGLDRALRLARAERNLTERSPTNS